LTPPYDALLDEAVDAWPILNRFRQDEAAGIQPHPVEPVDETHPFVPEDNLERPDDEELDEDLEEEPVTVTPAVPPAELAAEIAAAARARVEGRVPTNVEFQTEGARRFAEELARATRGH
jgi:hypothetical protein